MTLENNQWELGGVVFGDGCRIDHEPEVSPGYSDLRNQDTANPVLDSLSVGRDRRTPGIWQFKLFVNLLDFADALDALDELANVWDAADVRGRPGEVMALRYRFADRTRLVYGRPGRFSAPLNNLAHDGYIQITADFAMTDPRYFDDEENAVDVFALSADALTGFDVPFEAPIDFVGESTDPVEGKIIEVRGRKATPAIIEFHGPSIDPVVDVGIWQAKLNGIIPAGETITLDARPQKLSATRKDGSPVTGGMVSRTTRIADLVIPRGDYAVTHTSRDTMGLSKATVRWRNAYLAP